MNIENSRRRLLKIIAGVILSIISGLFGATNSLAKSKKTRKYMKINKTSILSKVSLPETGPWPTEDPFLFCVHHNDNYPAAKDDLSPNVSLSGRHLGNDFSTGSLGMGLSLGIGVAIACKKKEKNYKVYVVIGDGECNEGSIWESAMLAASNSLYNLTVLIDFNKWQATGRSKEIMALDPLLDKWKSFGWHSQEIDGHDFNEIRKSLINAKKNVQQPSVIIAHTVKGKGISFMEDDNNWHYRIPNENELSKALKELKIK